MTGDEAAVERLVAAVWPGCFRLAASVIGERSLAEDAAQEACVIVHRKVRGLQNASAFDTWLYRIVMRESARVRRRHQITTQLFSENHFVREETATLDVWRALAALTPELRDVIVLFYFDDLKGSEIAAILGLPGGTVRTRLARARNLLRGILIDYHYESQLETKEAEQHG